MVEGSTNRLLGGSDASISYQVQQNIKLAVMILSSYRPIKRSGTLTFWAYLHPMDSKIKLHDINQADIGTMYMPSVVSCHSCRSDGDDPPDDMICSEARLGTSRLNPPSRA